MQFNKIIKISLIIIAGILFRIYFNIGHIFSDDAYYSYLSFNLFIGDFPGDYLGYPVSPLRINHLLLTAFSYFIFGVSEFSTIVFSFIFSVGSILVAYRLAKLISDNESISITAAFLLAFFPIDVVFATIHFVDIPAMFFVNLGIYFLLKSYKQNKISIAALGGFFLFISIQFKETIYYTTILLGILWIYYVIKNKKINYQITIGLIFIIVNFIIEGGVYLFLHNDFLYRFTITQLNYDFCYYNFFPYTAQKFNGTTKFWNNIFNQIFVINSRSVFLRRFYLLLPLVAAVQSLLDFKRKKYPLLSYWFFGTLILLVAFTTSFSSYKPLDLQISWYVYPLFMPMILQSAILINRSNKFIRYGLLAVYFIASIVMCNQYEIYFNKNDGNEFKSLIRSNSDKMIYTDHFTKYSIDLLRNYENRNLSARIVNEDFNFNIIKNGEWIVYSKKHIDELKMQKFEPPDFEILKSSEYQKIKSFKDFEVYEKVHN